MVSLFYCIGNILCEEKVFPIVDFIAFLFGRGRRARREGGGRVSFYLSPFEWPL